MQNNERLEEIAMQIIANSGAERAASFEALTEAKKGNFGGAEELLKKAGDYAHLAHEAHRELLAMDAKGEVQTMGVLLAHAQDHLMSSMLAEELIKEIIDLHKNMKGGDKEQ